MKVKIILSVVLAVCISFCGLFGCKKAPETTPVASVSYQLSADDFSIILGEEYTPELVLTANGVQVDNATYTFKSANTEIISIENGKLKANKVGTTSIEATATVNNSQVAKTSFSCKVNENKGIHPFETEYLLYVSDTVKGVSFETSKELSAVVYENGNAIDNATIEWTVEDSTIASIEGNLLSAVSVGETFIVGTYRNSTGNELKTLKLPVSVQIPVLETEDDVIIDKQNEFQVLNAEKILGVNNIGSIRNVSLGREYSVTNNQILSSYFKAGEYECVFYDENKTIGVQVNLVAADFVVYDKEDLLLVSSFTNGYIVLANDIDSVDYSNTNNKTFTGVFNGLGHTISNINFKTSTGLFYRVNGATIKNVAITNATIEQASSGVFFYQTQGGETIIDNTYVEVKKLATVWQCGGAFAYVWRGTVVYSNSMLIVDGVWNSTNGLLSGRNNSQITIKNSYVLGEGILCGTSNKENANFAATNRLAGVVFTVEEDFLTAISKGKTNFTEFNKYWDFSQTIPKI